MIRFTVSSCLVAVYAIHSKTQCAYLRLMYLVNVESHAKGLLELVD